MIAWAVQSICAPGQICNFLVFLAWSLLQESGDIAPASRRMLQARIYGGFQFLEAGVTAMVSVE